MTEPTNGSSGGKPFRSITGTTRWSLVLSAGHHDLGASRLALADLCELALFPTYAWLRSDGMQSARANRAARRLLRDLQRRAAHEASSTGPRNFRLFLADALARRSQIDDVSEPVGNDQQASALEVRWMQEVGSDVHPNEAFDRTYAKALIHRARERLAIEAKATRRERLFDALEPFLAKSPSSAALESLAFDHGMRPMLISQALERLRQRFRELVDTEIAETVIDADELAIERHALLTILSSRH